MAPPDPPTVLIVDDHPSFRAAARLLLEADGWTVVGEAVDGTHSLTAERALRPDMMLLDGRSSAAAAPAGSSPRPTSAAKRCGGWSE